MLSSSRPDRREDLAAFGAGPTPTDLGGVDRWWRAANYLSAAQIYLLDNPLLHQPLTLAHIKPRLLAIGARPLADLLVMQ